MNRARSNPFRTVGTTVHSAFPQNGVMGQPKSKRWIFAVLLAILFPAFAFHVSCVAVLGPGNWGSGMEEKVPEILDARYAPDVARYRAEFSEGNGAGTEPAAPPSGAIRGRVVATGHDEPSGLWIIQSHEGERWIDQQRFALWSEATQELDELHLPSSMIFEQPKLIRREGKIVLVLERWQSWFMPVKAKLRRYLNSWFDETLRPERALYLYDVETRALTYFGPGHTLVVAPNRAHGAFLRSGATASGFYSLHAWDFETGQIETLFSLHESDPGSGRSFQYRWSQDSRTLHLSGSSAGFERRDPERLEFNHLHIRGLAGLYQLD